MTTVNDALERLTDAAGFLRWRVADAGEALRDGELDCARLAADPDLVASAVATSADGRGSDDPQVAASLWWQGYAYRVAGTALACWLLTGTAPDARADAMAIGIARDRPSSVVYRPVAPATDVPMTDDVAQLVAGAFGSHLDRVAESLVAGCRLGTALVWGNVAAACASGAGAVREAAGTDWHGRLNAFLAAVPHDVARLGDWAPTPDGGWAYQRRTCCLWWKTTVSGGALCVDCSLRRRAGATNPDTDTEGPPA